MMKRIGLLCLLLVLFLCSCKAPTYEKILQKWEKADKMHLSLTHERTLTFDDADKEPETEQTTAKLKMKKEDGKTLYQYIETDKTPVYFTDGYEYRQMMDIKYRNQISEEDFLKELPFLNPLKAEEALVETLENSQFTVTLKTDWALDMIKTYNADFADSMTDGDMSYTVKTEKKRIKSYTYEFTLYGSDETEGAYTLKDIYTVKAEPTDASFSLPRDLSSYTDSNIDLKGYENQSEEEWQRQVLHVILEALYNPDGSKTENFDKYYEDFKEMYGEELMEIVTDAADMFRGQ
ncbi:MAG: hypothetical protein HFE77_01100 [Clostridiales bacterium]|nr:hypothetical protein [Clostridiales bacterium]